MICPRIGDSKVLESRETEDGTTIRRRRVSADGRRFTTYERIELPQLYVRKRSGNRELFDRDKLARSISLAVRKRPVDAERVEKVVNSIQRQLEISGESEISSNFIGEKVMEALAMLDHIAYIRFASVYKDFREVKDFEDFVETIDRLAKPELFAGKDVTDK